MVLSTLVSLTEERVKAVRRRDSLVMHRNSISNLRGQCVRAQQLRGKSISQLKLWCPRYANVSHSPRLVSLNPSGKGKYPAYPG